MTARVTDNGMAFEAFAVTDGVKPGCLLVPTLFSLMFSVMLIDAYRDEQLGIRIAYRTDGHLLNSRRMQATTRVSKATVHDFLFADDCVLHTVTGEAMERCMDIFATGCTEFGLKISIAKMVVMPQPTLSRNTKIDDEVAQLISKAIHVFGQLKASVWNRHGIYLNTKLKMFNAIVLKTLLYGAET
ncbi:unnamed protein product [Schistocephalus solidus]|uniref:Reverse transcriptase domain-containing protein n=1 Tax=Schistocephalus solidus TaxID=70667 RepID=A0A183SDV8_SCHSO|nr:unnamed protein product [Schistocephalus solidus]